MSDSFNIFVSSRAEWFHGLVYYGGVGIHFSLVAKRRGDGGVILLNQMCLSSSSEDVKYKRLELG